MDITFEFATLIIKYNTFSFQRTDFSYLEHDLNMEKFLKAVIPATIFQVFLLPFYIKRVYKKIKIYLFKIRTDRNDGLYSTENHGDFLFSEKDLRIKTDVSEWVRATHESITSLQYINLHSNKYKPVAININKNDKLLIYALLYGPCKDYNAMYKSQGNYDYSNTLQHHIKPQQHNTTTTYFNPSKMNYEFKLKNKPLDLFYNCWVDYDDAKTGYIRKKKEWDFEPTHCPILDDFDNGLDPEIPFYHNKRLFNRHQNIIKSIVAKKADKSFRKNCRRYTRKYKFLKALRQFYSVKIDKSKFILSENVYSIKFYDTKKNNQNIPYFKKIKKNKIRQLIHKVNSKKKNKNKNIENF